MLTLSMLEPCSAIAAATFASTPRWFTTVTRMLTTNVRPGSGAHSTSSHLSGSMRDLAAVGQSRGDPDKWLDVEWAPQTDKMFDVGIRVTVVNQRGVLAKVATAIAEGGSNIDNVSMDEERSLYTTMHFTLQVANRLHLAKVLRALRRVREVVRIARVKD